MLTSGGPLLARWRGPAGACWTGCVAVVLAGGGVEGLLHRFWARLRTFAWMLTHDTPGLQEKALYIPYFLGTWFLASMLVSPASLGLLKLMRAGGDLRKVAGVNFGLAVTQVAFFAVNWYVIGWNDRSIDVSVFGVTLIPASLIAMWGLQVSLLRGIIYAFVQAVLAFLIIFLVLFAGTETGHVIL
jgi:hypothetical protein